jgi:hypothetical protein
MGGGLRRPRWVRLPPTPAIINLKYIALQNPMYRNRYRVRRGPPFGFAGVLIIVGALVLLNNLDILKLGYVFSLMWPGLLMLIGIRMIRGRPKVLGLFLALLGGIYFAQNAELLPASWDIGRLWPVFLVSLGVYLMVKGRRTSQTHVEL